MDRIELVLKRALRMIAALGALFLLLVAGLAVVDILVREFTGRPVHGAHDISKLLTIVIVAACFPAGLMERRQIKVTLIQAVAGPRANRVMGVIAELATLFMFACIAWFLTQHAIKVSGRAEVSMILNTPVGPWWWAAAALFWACLPAQLFVIAAEATGRPPETEEV
ncbi:TRAP transporter small permease subunit [Pseudooceanicola aestuarii]|uniref:TRAP transporter small permease subunit n=1 Tax=Pseudooceanicola aestuarii TaxID=2697319 RepID=UPI0013D58049|nr:TRAP transporter small permease subunit [Pseudooceanicola aestuarii]